MKSFLIKPYAWYLSTRVNHVRTHARRDQNEIFRMLVNKGEKTAFGKDHDFAGIRSHADFAARVPIRDYEKGKNYFDRTATGEADVLWPGKPRYLAKTSGTTSGVKYIPITPDSLPNHIDSARLALLNYTHLSGNHKIFNGKVMFLSGSPELETQGDIPTGRLSGIVNHEIPGWLKGNQLPSYRTNCIGDWETKVEEIVRETVNKDLRLISGIPPWVQMFFEKVIEKSGKNSILEVFPNLTLFIYGGVNYEPYRNTMESILGRRLDSLEVYPASEGFIAFQDTVENNGLLLNTASGIFYEFIPLEEMGRENITRLTIEEVETGKEYVLIVNNNAGLWGYNLGDTIRFVSTDPYRIVVSGRVSHFISAFGEHVIGKEVEQSLNEAAGKMGIKIVEFTVAPQVNPPEGGLPYHEWFIEFDKTPDRLEDLSAEVDKNLRMQNIYYDDLIRGNILKPLVIRPLVTNAFRIYMKGQGKLGGQNKVPRLSNNRHIADKLVEQNLTVS